MFAAAFFVPAVVPSRSLSRLNPTNPKSWSVNDVCVWLLSEGLGGLGNVETFKKNKVDGGCLLSLDNKLLKDLGIAALGDRLRLLRHVEAVKREFLERVEALRRRR